MGTETADHGSTADAWLKRFLTELYFSVGHRVHVPAVPKVVMYHSVGGDDRLAVSRERFRSQLSFLQRYYDIVDLPAAASGEDPATVALTFDDGLGDFATVALPILREFAVPATVFVAAASVTGDQSVFDAPTMSAETLAGLADDPLVTIGNHTRTHPDLTTLDPAAQRAEIVGARRDLEDRFGITVDRFAYPGGAYDEDSVDIVRDSHDFAVTVEQPIGGQYTDATLPRLHAHLLPPHFQWPLTSFSHLYHGLG